MTFAAFKQQVRTHLAALALLALAACGGGGGDAGIEIPGSSTTTLAAAQELVNTFAATLTGSEVTPSTASTAQGSGSIVVNPGTRVATVTVSTSGIVPTAVLVQEGAPGTTGGTVFALNETAPGSGVWTTKFTFTEAQLGALQAGNYYFIAQSAGFPNGEIRGQILSQQTIAAGGGTNNAATSGLNAAATATTTTPNAFIAALRGSQEVPANASTAQGSGAVLTDPSRRSLLVAVTTTGIVGTAAHIHSGQPGVAGPILVPLVETPAGSGIWIANATLTDEQYSALTSGGLYLNVHSTAFPQGEIRGQILPVQQSVVNSTGTGNFTNVPAATGTGTTGTGLTGTGLTGTGLTGTGLTSTGLTGTGLTGTGLTGTGLTDTGLTGTGLTGTGLTGTGLTGTGLTGTGLTGTGLTGTGLTGTGLTGTGLTGTGLTGIGTTTGTGTTIGTGLTGTGSTIGTGLTGTGTGTTGMGTTGTSTIGTGLTGFGF